MNPARAEFRQEGSRLDVIVSGTWSLADPRPELAPNLSALAGMQTVRLCVENLQAWDSGLVSFLTQLSEAARKQACALDTSALPEGLARLIQLALAVPRQETQDLAPPEKVLIRIGQWAQIWWHNWPNRLAFVGEMTLSLGRFFTGRARYRKSDLLWLIEETGPRALPIVSLISFLVGTILAYMGAAQLALFGAQIYIADLVSIGMVREVAALMTGIILAGRTGASFAAQLGTMQVNEEIDAFRTLGIPPSDYLVLPRFLALILMAPLLTLYAGIVGVLAGMMVALLVYDVSISAYYFETINALSFTHFAVGVCKGTVYGGLVAFSGCLCGMRCGRSAQAVGEATTLAVVMSILLITIFASLLTIAFQKLGI